MRVKVGTFNLNNLASRYNFRAEIDAAPATSAGGITLTFDEDAVSVRAFMGRPVKAKPADDTATVARRITDVMDADLLAVRKVEHIEILKQFNREHPGNLYPHLVLINALENPAGTRPAEKETTGQGPGR